MADSGLFNELRRIQIKKSYLLPTRVSGCAQERLEGIYAATFSLHSSPCRNPHLTTAAFFRRPRHNSLVSWFRKGIDRKVVGPRLRFPAPRGRTLGSKPNRLLCSRPLCGGFRPLGPSRCNAADAQIAVIARDGLRDRTDPTPPFEFWLRQLHSAVEYFRVP